MRRRAVQAMSLALQRVARRRVRAVHDRVTPVVAPAPRPDDVARPDDRMGCIAPSRPTRARDGRSLAAAAPGSARVGLSA